MARIIGGSMIGELSGKLGGNVFARNKGGAYIRQYVIPVDPRTISQLNARNSFGIASSSYHSMNPAQKSRWNNFASSVFNPKTGKIGVSSGFNAFVGLNTSVISAKIRGISVTNNLVTVPITSDEYRTSSEPPVSNLEANFGVYLGTPIQYAITDTVVGLIDWAEDTVIIPITMTANFTNVGTSFSPIGSTTDANGNKFGFKVFMSNPVQQKGMFFENPYLYSLGATPPAKFTTPVETGTGLDFKGTFRFQPGQMQSSPQPGQVVLITIFAMSETGMLLKLKSFEYQFPVI